MQACTSASLTVTPVTDCPSKIGFIQVLHTSRLVVPLPADLQAVAIFLQGVPGTEVAAVPIVVGAAAVAEAGVVIGLLGVVGYDTGESANTDELSIKLKKTPVKTNRFLFIMIPF